MFDFASDSVSTSVSFQYSFQFYLVFNSIVSSVAAFNDVVVIFSRSDASHGRVRCPFSCPFDYRLSFFVFSYGTSFDS